MADASIVPVFDLFLTTPGRVVHHLWGRDDTEPTGCDDASHKRFVLRTACGKIALVSSCDCPGQSLVAGWRSTWVADATRMRRDLAELLGPLCRVCEAHDAR